MRSVLWACIAFLALITACGPTSVHFVREGPDASRLLQMRQQVSLVRRWTYDADRSYEKIAGHLIPAVGDDSIFVAEPGGNVSALDLVSGDWQWQVEIGHVLTAGVGLGDISVLVATGYGEIIALDRIDGNTIWTRQVGVGVSVRPIVADGVVVVRIGDGQVIGLDERSGEIEWRLQRSAPSLSVHGVSAPLVIDQVVVVGFSAGNLIGIDLHRGTELWNLVVAESRSSNEVDGLIDIDADPIVLGGLLVVAAYQRGINAYGLRNLERVWRSQRSVLKNLAITDHGFFVTDDEGVVIRLNSLDGALVWRQTGLHGRGVSGPAILDNRLVLVGDYQGFVHILDAEKGEFVGRSSTGRGAVLTLIARGSRQVFVVSEDGSVSAWALKARN